MTARPRKYQHHPSMLDGMQTQQRRFLSMAERIAARCEYDGECWVWTGCRDTDGYGYIACQGHSLRVHAEMYCAAFGAIPEGTEVAHTCHRRNCCRPDHLVACSHKANMQMMASAGRSPHAKLTPEQVREARDRYAAGGISTSQLAREYGIGQGSMSRVLRGISYPQETPN